MSIIVKVHNGYFYAGKEHVPVDGSVTVIPARNSATYELVEQLSGKAPASIKVEKRGKDLAISVDDDSTADIIIQSFFLHADSQVVGLGNDGNYYSYLPDQSEFDNLFGEEFSSQLGKKLNPLTWYEKYFGDDNSDSQASASGTATGMQTLGLYSYGKATPWLLDAKTEPMGDLLKPVLGALGLSGLVMLGIENSKEEDRPQTTPTAPTAPTATINKDGTEVTGEGEAGSTVRVFNGTSQLGSSTVGSDGKYTIKLENTPTNGERLRVNAVKDGSNPSRSATVNAPDTTKPDAATEVAINETGTQVTGKAEARATVKVLDEFDNELGTAQAQGDGSFTVTLRVPQAAEQSLKVVVSDSQKNASDAVTLKGTKGANTIITQPVDIDTTPNTVAEDSKVGSKVGVTVKSTDYEKVTYTLTDNAGGKFAIDANTGVVTLANTVDFETARTHQIIVRATSTDGSLRDQRFTIQVTNVNDNKVGDLTDSNTAKNAVNANAKVGDKVGITAAASDADGDRVTYSLTDSASGKFSINADSGEVLVAKTLSNATGSATIKVKATSADGSTSEKDFTVTIDAVTQSRPIQLDAVATETTTQPRNTNTPEPANITPASETLTDLNQLLVIDSTPVL